ncbi:hypothetical protein, partial [[Clostridium] innocuum]|uniref:hypothetical protein n=1 Tax=Clostridium innocuum TaxID=1522 RepID=UPI001CA32ECD
QKTRPFSMRLGVFLVHFFGVVTFFSCHSPLHVFKAALNSTHSKNLTIAHKSGICSSGIRVPFLS